MKQGQWNFNPADRRWHKVREMRVLLMADGVVTACGQEYMQSMVSQYVANLPKDGEMCTDCMAVSGGVLL